MDIFYHLKYVICVHSLYQLCCITLSLAAICWSFHYIKRLLETVFVHRFSHATMPIANLFRVSITSLLFSQLSIKCVTELWLLLVRICLLVYVVCIVLCTGVLELLFHISSIIHCIPHHVSELVLLNEL